MDADLQPKPYLRMDHLAGGGSSPHPVFGWIVRHEFRMVLKSRAYFTDGQIER